MLDYRIETFLTLYEEMNYRRTAERLRMTQPGVTQHIHHLENFYGVKLFAYDGRQLRRTKEAEQLKRHIDSTQAAEHDLRAGFVQTDMLHLRVGATKTIGEFVIVPTVRAFLRDEHHRLDLIVDNTETLLSMLEHGELDFAIIEGVFDKEKYPQMYDVKEGFILPIHHDCGSFVVNGSGYDERKNLRHNRYFHCERSCTHEQRP